MCLIVTMVLLGVSVLWLELYRARESAVARRTLRAEVDALRRDVDKLRQRLDEQNILNDLKQFEDSVYAAEASTDDDEYSEYSDMTADWNLTPDASDEDSSSSGEDDHHAKHYNMDHARKRRDAVPVIAGSYGAPANRTEGLRLYESLVAGNHEVPVVQTTEVPVKQYHRVSPLWSPKQHRKKYRQHHATESPTGVPSAIISRPSRVMKTDKDPSRRVTGQMQTQPPPPPPSPPSPPQELRDRRPASPVKAHEGEILFRVYQEQRAVPESTIKSVDIIDVEPTRQQRRRKKQGGGVGSHKTLSSIEGVEERPPVNMRHRLLPAAHFNGDTSRYTQAHEHYDGNGRLRHPDGVFTDWSPSKWVHQLGMDRHFKYEDGAVSIKNTGLYLVYAQIHYLDEHDINGYRVYVNEDPMLQCTTMTHSMGRERVKKSNTCFTAAALFLTENDRLSLSDIGGLRYSVFEPAKSFFGLILLGNVNIK